MTAAEPEFDRLAVRVQALAGEQRYPEAQRALEEYGGMLRAALESLSPGDPRVLQLAGEWLQLLEATRRRVLAGRSHAAARLAQLPRPRPFCEPMPRRSWELFG